MKTSPLEIIDGSHGAQVPLKSKDQARGIIDKVLLPDAIKTLSRLLPEEDHAVIEIRGKICSRHPYFSKKLHHYGTPCPDGHEGRSCCGIAWLYFYDATGSDIKMSEGPLFDFEGHFPPAGAAYCYELARMEIKLLA